MSELKTIELFCGISNIRVYPKQTKSTVDSIMIDIMNSIIMAHEKEDVLEIEEQRYGRNKSTVINHTYVNSGSYRRKFDKISESSELNKRIYQLSKRILDHRSGTLYEDMYWLDPDTYEIVVEETNAESEEEIIYTERIIKKLCDKNGLITIHSHPNSFPPSISDLNSNYKNGYALGIVICHDGKIFLYSSGQEINQTYYQLVVEEKLKDGYNEYEAQVFALQEMEKKFDIICKEVTDNDS